MNDVTRCDGCNDFLDGYGDHCNNCPNPRMRSPACLHTTAKKGLIRGLKLLEAEAKKSDDVVAVKLHVHTNNKSALRAYEKAGMKRTPEYPYIYNLK